MGAERDARGVEKGSGTSRPRAHDARARVAADSPSPETARARSHASASARIAARTLLLLLYPKSTGLFAGREVVSRLGMDGVRSAPGSPQDPLTESDAEPTPRPLPDWESRISLALWSALRRSSRTASITAISASVRASSTALCATAAAANAAFLCRSASDSFRSEDSAAIDHLVRILARAESSSRSLRSKPDANAFASTNSSVSERTLPSSTMALDLADATADSASLIRAAEVLAAWSAADGFASIHIDSVRNGVRLVTPPTRTVHLSAPPPSPKYVDRYSTVSLPSVLGPALDASSSAG